jgi:hypothetical protein
MKKILLGMMLATTAFVSQAADVGVSVSIGQPGFYGRIDIGSFPRPQLLYPQPVIIQRTPVQYAPVYLHVPPGHAKDWGKHCRHYNACARPVYFVQESWYNDVYVPTYQERHGHGHDKGKDKGRDDYERYDQQDWDKPGKGKGHGHGRGRDRD